MSTTDARGHTVPSGTDQAARQALLDLSLSIPSVRTVASVTAATQHVASLVSAGLTPSPDSPVWALAGGVLCTWDGSAWTRVAGGAVRATVTSQGSRTVTGGATTSLATAVFSLPARATVRVTAGAVAQPAGNAAGVLRLRRNNAAGEQLGAARFFHSRGTAYHQWPSVDVEVVLDAGSHALVLAGEVGSGSNQVVYDQGTLTVTYA